MNELCKYFKDQKPGEIVNKAELESLLCVYWGKLDNSLEPGMTGDKLIGRTENVFWDPPILRFSIERHGGYVQGSTRAEIQKWEVNIDQQSAEFVKSNYRQIKRMQPRLDIKKLASEIADLITNKERDERLKWIDEKSVRVLIGNIIPSDSAIKQTVEGRRKRFRQELNKLLKEQDWKEVRPNLFNKD